MDSREENDKIAPRLLAAIGARSAKVAVIGLGYVGLPLATSIARAGFVTTGFDIDPSKINLIRSGKAYIDAVTDNDLVELTQKNVLSATSDFANISSNDIVVICVPTPL